MHAAICDSLMLYPLVPIDSKLAIKEDILSDGMFVGEGWFVNYFPYAMGRMESIWGNNCLEYNSKRWLESGICVGEFIEFLAFQAGS
eukprot:Gb_22375 [translate_table: standard]